MDATGEHLLRDLAARSTPTRGSPATIASTPCAPTLEMAGDPEAAVAHYRKAASRTSSVPERNYLIMKAGRLEAGGR